MKITVICESTMNDDGVDTKTTYEHNGVEFLGDLAYVYEEAARAIGFPYVSGVTIKTDEGREF